MHRFISVRLATVALATATVALLPLAGPASAATGAQCTKLVPGVTDLKKGTSTSTLSACTPTSATGGGGKSVSNIKTGVSTTTWNGGKGTTITKTTYKAGPKVNKCPTGSSLLLIVGKVTGGSGAALKAIPMGQAVSASVCLGANNKATLMPGTAYKF